MWKDRESTLVFLTHPGQKRHQHSSKKQSFVSTWLQGRLGNTAQFFAPGRGGTDLVTAILHSPGLPTKKKKTLLPQGRQSKVPSLVIPVLSTGSPGEELPLPSDLCVVPHVRMTRELRSQIFSQHTLRSGTEKL
jgi:hypothetical protein